MWASALRETDFLARLGGDEFLVLLPDCPATDAEHVARRMLSATASGDSFSIGIATWDGREAGYELIHRSDQAMYAAKAAGGSRITLAPPPATDRLSLVPDAAHHHGQLPRIARPSATP